MKQWGTEGLAYLTLDADVKEQLVHDPKALSAVIQAAMVSYCVNLNMKQWRTEGLAYLTLDADVKEQLVHDPKALSAVIQAAMVSYCVNF